MKVVRQIIFIITTLCAAAVSFSAQTTAFTYQGRLTDGGNPANGSFQMQFKLFDSLSAGIQIGAAIADVPVTANQGTFTVRLDFGSNALSGANRWLEIAVRHNSGESYSTLSPREQLASSPYSVRTLSAASADLSADSQKLGGVAANQYVQTTDSRLSDARNPLPGSGNYIQNATSLLPGSFNLTGSGSLAQLFVGVGGISATGGITVNGSGQFNGSMAFGTTFSSSRLTISAQDGLRIAGFQPFLTLQDSNSNNKQSFVQGVNGDAVLLTNSRASFTLKDASGDVIIAGNASQPASSTGLVKFGILVNADGSLNLCFNAQNPASCGVTVSHPSAGQYDLTFPVQINSRIFSATLVLDPNFNIYNADEIIVRPTSIQTVRVRTNSTYGATAGTPSATAFYLTVF